MNKLSEVDGWGVVDFYAVLGVDSDSPSSVIEGAYAKKMWEQGADKGFRDLLDSARTILVDPALRSRYDAELAALAHKRSHVSRERRPLKVSPDSPAGIRRAGLKKFHRLTFTSVLFAIIMVPSYLFVLNGPYDTSLRVLGFVTAGLMLFVGIIGDDWRYRLKISHPAVSKAIYIAAVVLIMGLLVLGGFIMTRFE